MKCNFCRKPNHTESSCYSLQIQSIKGQKVAENIYDIFTNLIAQHFEKQRLDEKSVKNAMRFIRELEQIILAKTGHSLELQPFGSLKSGFGTRESDFDLCIKRLEEDSIDTVSRFV
jgi:DNA polymerase sigma